MVGLLDRIIHSLALVSYWSKTELKLTSVAPAAEALLTTPVDPADSGLLLTRVHQLETLLSELTLQSDQVVADCSREVDDFKQQVRDAAAGTGTGQWDGDGNGEGRGQGQGKPVGRGWNEPGQGEGIGTGYSSFKCIP